nr:zinc finger protein OZF isoform X4 [Peromyscus maniculatus bairdii]
MIDDSGSSGEQAPSAAEASGSASPLSQCADAGQRVDILVFVRGSARPLGPRGAKEQPGDDKYIERHSDLNRLCLLKGKTFSKLQALSLKHNSDLNRKLYGKESSVFRVWKSSTIAYSS